MAALDITLVAGLRAVLLALTLWGGYILAFKIVHRQDASGFNVAWPSVTGSLLAWAMGWLS